MTILDRAINELHEYRELVSVYADKPEKHYRAEYAYQLISLLMESQKLLTEQFFATDYIQEKCMTLGRHAEYIKHEDERHQK